jgi:hypothetical protein
MRTLNMLLIALALCCTPALANNCKGNDARDHATTEGKGDDHGKGDDNCKTHEPERPERPERPEPPKHIRPTPPPVNVTSTNTNTNTATSSSSSTASANGNGNNSNNTTVEAPKIPVSSAITPPIMPTVPCFKGFGGSAQTMAFGASFGGGKIDKGCNARELARSFSGPQTVASCKILLATKEAKAAGITMEDCLPPLVLTPVAEPITPVVAPIPVTVNIVLPNGDFLESKRTVTPSVTKKAVQRHRHMTPSCQNVVQ